MSRRHFYSLSTPLPLKGSARNPDACRDPFRELEGEPEKLQKGYTFIKPALLLFQILILLIGLISCLPDPLEVKNIPTAEQKIVVSSQFVPDQSLVILLTKSIGALDASNSSDPEILLNQIIINDAVVTIEGKDRIDTLLSLGSGAYGGVFIPFEAGQSYTLHVNSESLGSVEATTEVKQQINFESINASLYVSGDDTLSRVEYSIDDPMGKNWYMVNAQRLSRRNWRERLLNPRLETRLNKDDDFDGEVFSEKFSVFRRNFDTGDTLAVFLSNISEEYYDFMKLRMDTRFSLLDFLGEPVNYPSNVKGGLGYFNLFLPDVEIIILEEPI